jgi:hypothetical protein
VLGLLSAKSQEVVFCFADPWSFYRDESRCGLTQQSLLPLWGVVAGITLTPHSPPALLF